MEKLIILLFLTAIKGTKETKVEVGPRYFDEDKSDPSLEFCNTLKKEKESQDSNFQFYVDKKKIVDNSRPCHDQGHHDEECFDPVKGFVEHGYRINWPSGVSGSVGRKEYNNISLCYSEITLWFGGRHTDLYCCDGFYKVSQPEETIRLFADPREKCCNKFSKTQVKRQLSKQPASPVTIDICGDKNLVFYKIIIFGERRSGTLELRDNLRCCPNDHCVLRKRGGLTVILLIVFTGVGVTLAWLGWIFHQNKKLKMTS